VQLIAGLTWFVMQFLCNFHRVTLGFAKAPEEFDGVGTMNKPPSWLAKHSHENRDLLKERPFLSHTR
jgi:hypothetical protein